MADVVVMSAIDAQVASNLWTWLPLRNSGIGVCGTVVFFQYGDPIRLDDEQAKVFVVLWSKGAVRLESFISAATKLQAQNKMIGVAVDDCIVPAPFDKSLLIAPRGRPNWLWTNGDPDMAKLVATIQSRLGIDATKVGRIFVSHSASDNAPAMEMVQRIEAGGRRCWIAPRDVQPGRDFRNEIVSAIENCGKAILLLSARSNASKEVLREVTLLGEARRTIVPVRLDETALSTELKYLLAGLHWVRYPQDAVALLANI